MNKNSFFGLLGVAVFPFFIKMSLAATPAEQLAKDSYDFVDRMESMLDGSIKSGSKEDFNRFTYQPTVSMMQKWPKLGESVSHDKYIRCYFAVTAFRVYSEDQFKAGGRLPKSSTISKDYFEQKKLCKAALPK